MQNIKENILEIKNISKSFATARVLDNINLEVKSGEFITLLGSSGCGKTTLLRILAGLETPDRGAVLLQGEDITERPANKRDMSMVFQNYALFPHMNVAANIAYSLKLKKATKEEMQNAVEHALSLVRLEGYEKRMPSELSGGQRQRVAIARSIVSKPKLLLLDEPLGALDLQLRRQMQTELKRLQKQLGITFIYITHDQEEALNMSSRIAIMREGRFEQIGTPTDIYDKPETSFVASFVGSSNLFEGTVESINSDEGTMKVVCKDGVVNAITATHHFEIGENVRLAVRSENIGFKVRDRACDLVAVVSEKMFTGGQLRLSLQTESGVDIIVSRHGIDSDIDIGGTLCLTWKAEHAIPVDVNLAKSERSHEQKQIAEG